MDSYSGNNLQYFQGNNLQCFLDLSVDVVLQATVKSVMFKIRSYDLQC